jgi:hypothetical protein
MLLFPHIIQKLETHCTHLCNLNCAGCTHYSNHHHGTHVPVDYADEQMKMWNKLLFTKRFGILGGEPALHPNLPQFIEMTRKNWPKSVISVVSNGLLLPKLHPDLGKTLQRNKCVLVLNQHYDSPEFSAQFEESARIIKGWSKKYEIPISLRKSFKIWRLQYLGFGDNMMPFTDNDAITSWKNCPAKRCFVLFEGKIWKCPPIAYLQLQARKFNLNFAWEPYINYTPLDRLTCSRADIRHFFSLHAESCCAMCPAFPRNIALPDPTNKIASQNYIPIFSQEAGQNLIHFKEGFKIIR